MREIKQQKLARAYDNKGVIMSDNKNLHPVIWVAAVAVIAVSGVGIAKMGGWMDTPSDTTIAGAADAKAGKITPAPAKRPASKELTRNESRDYGRNDRNPSVNSYPARHRYCTDCGVVEAVRKVEVPVKASGVGAVAGGVVGGVLGHQAGEGTGKDVATVAGAVLGGLAGHQVEKRVRTTTTYEVDVTMQDGSRRTVPYASAPGWQRGDDVRVDNGVISAASGRTDSL